MKNIIFIYCAYFSLCFAVFADDSLLEIKQSLERINRDIIDLQKVIFSDKLNQTTTNNNDQSATSEITVFDMRLRDIENELKSINLLYENMSFEIEEFKKSLEQISIKLNNSIIDQNNFNITQNNNLEENNITTTEPNQTNEPNQSNEKNQLGTLKINSIDLSESESVIKNNNVVKDDPIKDLLPEEQFQLAFDFLRTQKFVEAKSSLELFIKNNPKHELTGSAQYWLGEMSLLKKEYREAALIFAEGYQKYPESLKAPDSLYKLAQALVMIEKKEEACETFNQFIIKYPENKLIDKTKSKIDDLQCN